MLLKRNHIVTFWDWPFFFFSAWHWVSFKLLPGLVVLFNCRVAFQTMVQCGCSTVYPLTQWSMSVLLPVFGDYKKPYDNFAQSSLALSKRVWLWERELHTFLLFGITNLDGVCSWKAQTLGWEQGAEKTQVHEQVFGLTVPKIMGLSQSKPKPVPCRPDSCFLQAFTL